MKNQRISRNFWIFSLAIFIIFCLKISADFDGFRLEGSPELGIPPRFANKICEKIGGKLAVLTPKNRLIFRDQLFQKCNISNDFCPKMCVSEEFQSKINTSKSIDNDKNGRWVTSTQPIFLGDTMHIDMEIEDNSLEILQLSYALLNDIPIDSVQKVIFQLSIFSNYTDKLQSFQSNPNEKLNGISIGSGEIKKTKGEFVVSEGLANPTVLQTEQKFTGRISLKLEFNKDSRLVISSQSIFGDEKHEISIEKPAGRAYFEKIYDKSKVLDVYFTRGNCSKKDFEYQTDKGFVNCRWTRPVIAIPVYSCRMASYVACDNVPDSIINSTTDKTDEPTVITKAPQEPVKSTTVAPKITYFYADFMDDYGVITIVISALSMGLLIGSIVLEVLKMRSDKRTDKGKK